MNDCTRISMVFTHKDKLPRAILLVSLAYPPIDIYVSLKKQTKSELINNDTLLFILLLRRSTLTCTIIFKGLHHNYRSYSIQLLRYTLSDFIIFQKNTTILNIFNIACFNEAVHSIYHCHA
mgnify:CR=1 FL=1